MAKRKRTSSSREISGKDCPTTTSSIVARREGPASYRFRLAKSARTHRRCVDGKSMAQGPHLSTTSYQYIPLKENRKEIRLLTLHNGDFHVDLRISIDIVRLTPVNPPIFEALSYVWGSEDNAVDIQVGSGTLSITRNLAEALIHLRHKDERRRLWVDAICVNQRDLKERSLQVKRMADVYKLAKNVVAFLGPAKSNSGDGMRILGHLGSQIKYDWLSGELKPASDDVDKDWSSDRKSLPYGKKEQLGIYEVLQRPWFERLWIQQEIRLSNQSAILMCGFDSIAWQHFRPAIMCLFKKSWSENADANLAQARRACSRDNRNR